MIQGPIICQEIIGAMLFLVTDMGGARRAAQWVASFLFFLLGSETRRVAGARGSGVNEREPPHYLVVRGIAARRNETICCSKLDMH